MTSQLRETEPASWRQVTSTSSSSLSENRNMILGNHPFSKQKFFFGIKLSSLQPPPFFDYLWGSQKDLGVSKIYPVINIKSLDSNTPPLTLAWRHLSKPIFQICLTWRQMFHEDLNFQQTLQTLNIWMYAILNSENDTFWNRWIFFSVSWEIMEIELLLAVDSK